MSLFIDPAVDPRPAPLAFNPFKALVAPRPIGWISTVDRDGAVNLAPYSFFNGVADDPPCVMFAATGAHVDGGAKDSLRNARETGEFVANVVTWDLREQMNRTASRAARHVDEMALAGLTPVPSRRVRPPRVAQSPAALECRVLQIVPLPEGRHGANHMVIGQVVGIHIDASLVVDGRIDTRQLRQVARLGYMDYCVVDEVFAMSRPD
ncbi:MAG TPA: flavin reductase family protein [Vineibacter sp.]|nr:flavin reductase family protein [Vineibacter sp.]